jgi:chemotaxis protein MotB
MLRLRANRGRRLSQERWLVSYADFITLLFAFFATLYAISKVDAQKLSTVAQAMQVAFDDSANGRARAAKAAEQAKSSLLATETAGDAGVQDAVSKALSDELASERLKLIVDRRGVTVSIPEAETFGVGRDELSETAQTLVARVAVALSAFPNAVRVEGHTDDVPIHTVRFQSNWDLSAARASRVVEFLIARGLQADRLSATGYAEFHPHLPNTSAAARASNRRIDLVILNPATTSAEEPGTTGPTP